MTAKLRSTAKAVLSLVLAALIAGCSSTSTPPANQAPADTRPAALAEGVQVGNLAPEFALRDADGRAVHLAEYRGKVVLFEFSAMW